MRKLLTLGAWAISALTVSAPLHAQTVLYNPAGVNNGYAGTNSASFTATLNAAWRVNATNPAVSTATFEKSALLAAADLVFVNVRGGGSTNFLSALEQANLSAYVASGKPIVLVGDNYNNFGEWGQSILSPFGASIGPWAFNYTGSATVANSGHPLSQQLLGAGVTQFSGVTGPGVVQYGSVPGTTIATVFVPTIGNRPVVAAFGPTGNALVVMDSNLFASSNTVFTTALVGATLPVPEPATYALLLGGMGLIGLTATRRQAAAARALS